MTQAFNLSQLANNLNTSGQLDATDGLTGAVPVANGGTGASSLTANNVLLGNGTGAVQVVAPSTSGNVLTSNGTTWVSSTPSGGAFTGARGQLFTSNGTFTIPTGVTTVKVTVCGGGAGGHSGYGTAGSGAGVAVKWLTGLTSGNTLTVTIGSGGAGKTSGGYPFNSGGSSTVTSGTQSISTITGGGGLGASDSWGSSIYGNYGGTATGGDLNYNGGASFTTVSGSYVSASGGAGGFASTWCGRTEVIFGVGGMLGGISGSYINGQEIRATGYGNGGLGFGFSSASQGNGSSGAVIFEW